MNFCPQCGKEIKENANFCVECGKRINEPAIQPTQSTQPTHPIPNTTTPKKSKAPLIIVIVLLVTVILVLGGILVFKTIASSPDSKAEATNSATFADNTENTVTDENTYTGIIRVEDASCYLDLGKETSIYLPDSDETLTCNRIHLGQDDYKTFKSYNGMTVTLKGELFNYRGGGTLMFTDTPTVVEASGTPEAVAKSATYQNWSTTDNETKLFDAGKVLESILLSCDEVHSAKVAFSSDTLESIDHDGLDFYAYAKVSINDIWLSDCGYDVMLYPTEENVIIYFGPTDAPDIPGYTYTWSGEFVSGSMPLDEYIVQEGLAK